jgi:hypothetical protein
MELDQTYVWITTRRLKPGAREEFSRAWRPSEFPEGMLRSYECYAPDGSEVVGISIWDSIESRERYRLSDVETSAARRWRRSSSTSGPGSPRSRAEDPGA